nr:hypothetical protein [uncultured Agathobaculum sp.]
MCSKERTGFFVAQAEAWRASQASDDAHGAASVANWGKAIRVIALRHSR